MNKANITFWVSMALTSIFMIFNLTGIIHLHWAYILVPMWAPITLMLVYYQIFIRHRYHKNDYSDDRTDEPLYRYDRCIEIIRERDDTKFKNRVNSFLLHNTQCIYVVTYLNNGGELIAVIEHEKRVKIAK